MLSTLIEQLDVNRKFIFVQGHEYPTQHLREVSRNVPKQSGMYFVFVKPQKEHDERNHLYFQIDNCNLELLYFGKAGGTTKKGKVLKQTLYGRINNVVNKDIPRAKYWEIEMTKHNESQYFVYWILYNEPRQNEDQIYSYLNKNDLLYPRMNRRLGR